MRLCMYECMFKDWEKLGYVQGRPGTLGGTARGARGASGDTEIHPEAPGGMWRHRHARIGPGTTGDTGTQSYIPTTYVHV